MNLYGLLDAIINKVNRAVKIEKQELDSPLQKQARENINVPSKNEVCNPNLLDNWYFLNPVNRRGQTSYTSGYNIDRWINHNADSTVSITSSGLTIKNNIESATFIFDQRCDFMAELQGKQVTYSFLVADVTGEVAVQCGGGAFWISKPGLHSGTVNSFNGSNIDYLLRMFKTATNTSITLVGAKVELGDTQTLAHQDSNGNWVLNEIPKYSEELLKCRQYDLYTGEYIGLRKFSQPRNLLDNSDFRNPVNQRNFVSGSTVEANTYFIDRWKTWETAQTITIDTEGLYAPSGIQQRICGLEYLVGKHLTCGIQFADGSLKVFDMTLTNDGGWSWLGGVIEDNLWCALMSLDVGEWGLIFTAMPSKVRQIALYEGYYTADTLPEYQPKGYAAELAECQRYYQNRSYEDTAVCHCVIGDGSLILPLSFKHPMRIEAPTISGSIDVAAAEGFQGAQTPGLGLSVQGFYAWVPMVAGYTFEEGKSYYAKGTVVLSAEL